MIYNILLFLSITFSVIAQLTLKYGARSYELLQAKANLFEKASAIITPLFIIATFFYGLSFLAYAVVLSKMEVSKAYPISVVSAVVLILLFSVIFLQESISILKVIGILLSILGVVLIFYK